jgi:hypothetical protein
MAKILKDVGMCKACAKTRSRAPRTWIVETGYQVETEGIEKVR